MAEQYAVKVGSEYALWFGMRVTPMTKITFSNLEDARLCSRGRAGYIVEALGHQGHRARAVRVKLVECSPDKPAPGQLQVLTCGDLSPDDLDGIGPAVLLVGDQEAVRRAAALLYQTVELRTGGPGDGQ